MPANADRISRFSIDDAQELAGDLFGIKASASRLPSERDQNFHLTSSAGEEFVLKVANAAERLEFLEAQNAALEHVAKVDPAIGCPRVHPARTGQAIVSVQGPDGQSHFARTLTYLPGTSLAEMRPFSPHVLRELGRFLARLDLALESFSHPGARREFYWDLRLASSVIRSRLDYIKDSGRRALLKRCVERFESRVHPHLSELRSSVIHGDGHEHNIIVDVSASGAASIAGILDFGDFLETHTAFEPAIAAAYSILDAPTLLANAIEVIRGYHEISPLTAEEAVLMYDLVVTRLCMSVSIGAYQVRMNPDNEYLAISQKSAWATLEQLANLDQEEVREFTRRSIDRYATSARAEAMDGERLLKARRLHISDALSIAYNEPLHIVRGYMQYLYDEKGRAYLDAVNNVCHVGHCHPRVVRAAQDQIARLNTNTRYLHENLVGYAERLCATFPDPLSVCFLVCSGSEANELALRLARTHTGARDIVVVDNAYHGNTSGLIEISPYKYKGPGGSGASEHVHEVPMPDVYRGLYREEDRAGALYADHVAAAIQAAEENGRRVGAFICESLLGCGGQIVLPEDYLKEAYRHARAADAVCIADEVQVGFARVGTHYWGFETQGIVPDIVTLGKPIGNGHPIGAVITTPEIAGSFANGMEYFNTFGGNPVSCAIGLAVLDVIEEEDLQANAKRVGARLKAGFDHLMNEHPLVGDVRGSGLFIGVEFVLDPMTREPATDFACHSVERLKECGILTSTDGPDNNVLKIKPPLVFTERNADELVTALESILIEEGQRFHRAN